MPVCELAGLGQRLPDALGRVREHALEAQRRAAFLVLQ
jgi:hypothetical protein